MADDKKEGADQTTDPYAGSVFGLVAAIGDLLGSVLVVGYGPESKSAASDTGVEGRHKQGGGSGEGYTKGDVTYDEHHNPVRYHDRQGSTIHHYKSPLDRATRTDEIGHSTVSSDGNMIMNYDPTGQFLGSSKRVSDGTYRDFGAPGRDLGTRTEALKLKTDEEAMAVFYADYDSWDHERIRTIVTRRKAARVRKERQDRSMAIGGWTIGIMLGIPFIALLMLPFNALIDPISKMTNGQIVFWLMILPFALFLVLMFIAYQRATRRTK